MIDRGHNLPLIRQADLLGLSRGSLYYQPRAVPAADLAVMRRIDELHLDYPFAGSRMLRDLLRGEGISIGRAQVAFHTAKADRPGRGIAAPHGDVASHGPSACSVSLFREGTDRGGTNGASGSSAAP